MELIKKCLKVHENCGSGSARPDTHTSSVSGTEIHNDNPFTPHQIESHPLLEVDNRSLHLHLKVTPPTRLIDVSGPDLNTVRIFNSHSLAHNHGAVSYLALSHCWGNCVSSSLTQHNISAFYSGVPIATLAQTFQDAIHVARGLSFSYLWIDSLCIIQGDQADWAREAILMKNVYASAACVIVAIASWDSSESFFAEQNPLAMHPCLVSVDKASLKEGGDFGIYALPHTRFTETSWEDIRFSRIKSRGWCFQEERLAKKIVWFGPNQIFFTCQSSHDLKDQQTVSQVGRYPWHSNSNLHHDYVPSQDSKAKDAKSNHNLSHSKYDIWFQSKPLIIFRSSWWKTANEYSTRFLTQTSDKLIAFAGLGDMFQDQLRSLEPASSDYTSGLSSLEPTPSHYISGLSSFLQPPVSHYISGLWGGSHLPSSLLWYVSQRHPRPLGVSDRGPSFAWPSVDGIIRNNSILASPLTCGLKIIDVVSTSNLVKIQPDFPLGVVHAAYIHLEGKLTPARWETIQETSKLRYYIGHPTWGAGGVLAPKDLKHFTPWRSDPSLGPEIFNLLDMRGQRIGIFLPDTTELPPPEIYCLKIVVEVEDEEEYDGCKVKEDFGVPFVARGLALIKAFPGSPEGTRAESTYRRIGYIELEKRGSDIGGMTYPDITSGSQSLRGYGLAVRRPWPVIDSSGFFGHPCSGHSEIWII